MEIRNHRQIAWTENNKASDATSKISATDDVIQMEPTGNMSHSDVGAQKDASLDGQSMKESATNSAPPSFTDFISNSTLHGVKYVFEEGIRVRR